MSFKLPGEWSSSFNLQVLVVLPLSFNLHGGDGVFLFFCLSIYRSSFRCRCLAINMLE